MTWGRGTAEGSCRSPALLSVSGAADNRDNGNRANAFCGTEDTIRHDGNGAQMAQSGGPTAMGQASDLLAGGACAWRLPLNESCASVSRSLLGMAMAMIGLTGDVSDAAVLAVSELATNAFRHGLRAGPRVPMVPPELWVRVRATPVVQLVVSVFDLCSHASPTASPSIPLHDHVRSCSILGMV